MTTESKKRAPDLEAEPERKHPGEWAKALKTPVWHYAGAAIYGASRWIQGVAVTRDEYTATVDKFLAVQIGTGERVRR